MEHWWWRHARSEPPRPRPRRRSPAAQHDAALADAGTPGFQNEGDNEVTGVHVSSGSPFVAGMQGRIGATSNARWFFTQQHGKNRLWEILPETP